MERHFIGAQGPEFALSFLQRCVVAGRALWFYLGKLLWPSGFVFIYPRWSIDAKAGWMCAYPVAALGLLGAAWILWRFRRSARGPLAAALFFGGSLFPVLGFLNVYPFRFSFVADHFQYLASLGFFALVAGGAAALWRRLAAPLRPVLPAAAAGILGVLGVLTWRLCLDYRDAETLYRATLARNPGAWLADMNLGSVLMERGRLAEAEIHYRAAEKEEPGNQPTHFDLGKLLLQQGRPQEAVDEFDEAVRLLPEDVEARDNLGVALAETGRAGEAEAQFREAIRLQPDNPTARYNLAVALQNGGRAEEAARSYEEALRLRPDYPEARRALIRLGPCGNHRGRVNWADEHGRSRHRGAEKGRKENPGRGFRPCDRSCCGLREQPFRALCLPRCPGHRGQRDDPPPAAALARAQSALSRRTHRRRTAACQSLAGPQLRGQRNAPVELSRAQSADPRIRGPRPVRRGPTDPGAHECILAGAALGRSSGLPFRPHCSGRCIPSRPNR